MDQQREVFVPLQHDPGHAQVDFGEALAEIAGVERKIHFFAMDLPHSDACFMRAYPEETAEAFCDGHNAAFGFFGKVPRSMSDGEALIGPGMKDARSGKPVVGQFRHPIPREAVLLAAAPERSTPEVGHVMPERRERPTICGYRIVSEMACNDLLQPVALIWDSLVHSPPQLRLDFLELRLHAVAPGLPLKLEEAAARFTADEGEAQEREGVRCTDTAFLAIDRRAAAELNHAGLDRVERQRECREPLAHCIEETTCVDDHVATGLLPSPAFGPQIEHVMQVDVAEEW